MTLVLLFAEFFKVGLFAVGGGLATLPFLYRMADRYEWLSYEDIANMIAISESTPGPIGVNMSTYTGFQCAGVVGAIITTLGLVCPSIIVIIIIAKILQSFKESPLVGSIFSGLRPAATGLIAAAGLGVIRLSLYNGAAPVWYELLRWRECILFAGLFLLIRLLKKHPIVYIAAAGIAGVIFGL
ncbi:chromate transport protein [Treponema primitia ZAS-2]|uniref:Chromate transport protein n=1 Tax=Treponema primitia (strain ATCC BAA-887 / DSM 12427 / ZAS-2) TaxID=545694 RepID=F5YJM8_TREPZ|nr:chromate transporter [Treponema primitia]AEF86958.1 chromate transport protein [Treponema primitia ZAS-2]